ncbi:MAG: hypothetical protein IKS19_04395 [Clostridia bacterium]|nr:hypothetical protein [Clostridia bacterium]
MQEYRLSHDREIVRDFVVDIRSGMNIFRRSAENIRGKYVICGSLLVLQLVLYFFCALLKIFLEDIPKAYDIPHNYYSAVSLIIFFIMIIPVNAIYKSVILRSSGADISVKDMLSLFSGRFFRLLILKASAIIISCAMIFLCFSPLLALYVSDIYGVVLPFFVRVPISAAGLMIGIFGAFYSVSSLFFCERIYLMKKRSGVISCIKMSVKMMRGKRTVLIALITRCCLTALGCVFIIPAFYCLPRIAAVFSEFAYDVCG